MALTILIVTVIFGVIVVTIDYLNSLRKERREIKKLFKD